MEEEDKKYLKLKIALTLNKLLSENKVQALSDKKHGKKDPNLIHSLLQLSIETGLRPASISSIFNGDSTPSMLSVLQILSKLDKSLILFSKCFENISEIEMLDFEEKIKQKKKIELGKKSKK